MQLRITAQRIRPAIRDDRQSDIKAQHCSCQPGPALCTDLCFVLPVDLPAMHCSTTVRVCIAVVIRGTAVAQVPKPLGPAAGTVWRRCTGGHLPFWCCWRRWSAHVQRRCNAFFDVAAMCPASTSDSLAVQLPLRLRICLNSGVCVMSQPAGVMMTASRTANTFQHLDTLTAGS